MGKRFTDTDKWRKPFIKGLKPELKLFWFYLLDDCDIAGLWQVDFDVAEIRIGCKLNKSEILAAFDDHIILLDNGDKWFVPSFLEFQNGPQLSKTNNIFKSIDKILTKYDLYQYLEIEISETGTTIGAMRGRVSQKTKDRIILQAEFICQYCSEQKTKNELVIDHFISLHKGGDNSDENLICSCIRCNSHKTDLMPDDFLSKQFPFINPTEKIISLNKKLKGAYSPLLGTKVIYKGNGQGNGQGEGTIQGQSDFEFEFKCAFDEATMEGYERNYKHKGINLVEQLNSFRLKCDNDKGSYYTRSSSTLRTNFQYQLDHARNGVKSELSLGDRKAQERKNKGL